MLLNDVHAQLNPVRVHSLRRPASLADIQAALREAAQNDLPVSISGGCHAMGGQQFAEGALHLDLRGLSAVLASDAERGWLTIEAGAAWPQIIAATHAMPPGNQGERWGIRQKQTGVDAVSLGGSISANAHGRGLHLQPLGDDIESLTLVDADARVHHCSREHNAELFALAIGGYGLFGVIYSATLRLTTRRNLLRRVDIIDLDEAIPAVQRRRSEGFLYGDFQFAIDPEDPGFLRRGVLACYQPCGGVTAPRDRADLAPEEWLELLRLAHDDKREAFRRYARHYLATDGHVYASDTHQLSTYIPGYAEFLQQVRGGLQSATTAESLLIGELYVPEQHLLAFMSQARMVLRGNGSEVIYGTIRVIARDTTSFLPWAREDFVCIVFNLRTTHDREGIARTTRSFRDLNDAAIALGGSFFLTYHRSATAAQILLAYPDFPRFLRKKLEYDPAQRFQSEWYRYYRDAFSLSDRMASVAAPT